jgi:hypothetical protein
MKKINLIKATTLKNLRDNVVIVSSKATYKRKFFIATLMLVRPLGFEPRVNELNW